MRCFRNSLKQALVLQCGSANAALSLPADLYVDMWEAIRRNNAPRYAHASAALRGGEPDAGAAAAAAPPPPPLHIPVRVVRQFGTPTLQQLVTPSTADGRVRTLREVRARRALCCRRRRLSLPAPRPPFARAPVHKPSRRAQMLAEFGVAVSGEAATQTSVVAHGIAVATDAPVLELWRALRHPDRPFTRHRTGRRSRARAISRRALPRSWAVSKPGFGFAPRGKMANPAPRHRRS